ncbi:MAG: LysR family transcriptional regulator [Archangium sp.]
MREKLRRADIICSMDVQMTHIRFVNTLDLNLLRVFEALMNEQSVSRAAAKLRLSQPATSSALNRLRESLKDPLLVRTRDGMVPTPRALALRGPIAAALRQLQEALVEPTAFDPAKSHTFVIAASDHAQLLVLPGLMKRLAKFPRLKLQVVPLPRDFPLGELEAGELDLVIGVFDLAPGDRAPRGLKRQVLAKDHYVVVGRKHHPAFKKGARFDLATPQLHVSPRGGTEGRFERKSKVRRNVVLFTPHYLVAPWVLAGTDMLAALPASIARRFVSDFPLQMKPAPLSHDALVVQQLWHPLRQDDSAHRWLREQTYFATRPSP